MPSSPRWCASTDRIFAGCDSLNRAYNRVFTRFGIGFARRWFARRRSRRTPITTARFHGVRHGTKRQVRRGLGRGHRAGRRRRQRPRALRRPADRTRRADAATWPMRCTACACSTAATPASSSSPKAAPSIRSPPPGWPRRPTPSPAERATLVKLVAAVGPLPSTPGQAETEAAIAGQRHALDMLARVGPRRLPDRRGDGAAARLAGDPRGARYRRGADRRRGARPAPCPPTATARR